jgi:hypothetical protein
MVIEAAGCLKTYEKTAAGHECTTLVMDKYKEVQTHTNAIQTSIFPALMGRPHAAPIVRGVLLMGRSSSPKIPSLVTSVSHEAELFWKVTMALMMILLLLHFYGVHDLS